MQDIMKEYGPALITIVVIIALVTLIAAMFTGTGEAPSFVQGKFENLITQFFAMAQSSGNLPSVGE